MKSIPPLEPIAGLVRWGIPVREGKNIFIFYFKGKNLLLDDSTNSKGISRKFSNERGVVYLSKKRSCLNFIFVIISFQAHLTRFIKSFFNTFWLPPVVNEKENIYFFYHVMITFSFFTSSSCLKYIFFIDEINKRKLSL
jgi:hypothetical protein